MFEKYVFLVLCPDITVINGHVNATTSPVALRYYYPIGTNASFSCNSGFELNGTYFASCLTDGSWNLPPPICRQGYETNRFYFLHIKQDTCYCKYQQTLKYKFSLKICYFNLVDCLVPTPRNGQTILSSPHSQVTQ